MVLSQVEFNELSMNEAIVLLETVDVFVGLHGGAFDNVPFLPRGAYVVEIMPRGSAHEPLYANRALTTGKYFIRLEAS
jgi:capsular polysaccharide biosynthesis protein